MIGPPKRGARTVKISFNELITFHGKSKKKKKNSHIYIFQNRLSKGKKVKLRGGVEFDEVMKTKKTATFWLWFFYKTPIMFRISYIYLSPAVEKKELKMVFSVVL